MTGTAPLVSIVIPAYRAEAYIADAIRSALAQTLRPIEVLVIDDASPDGTADLVLRMALADNRLRLIRSPENQGPAAARNRGIRAARGDWVALLDADDRFEPDRLAALLAIGEDRGADMVADNLLLDGPGLDAARPMLTPELLATPTLVDACAFLEGNLPIRGHPRVSYGFLKPMMRRRFLLDHGLAYDEQIRFAEDFLFYVDCLLAGARFWLIPEPLYVYSVREDSLTAGHGAAELRSLYHADRRLLRRNSVRQDRRLRTALVRHAASIEERLAWRLFTDGVKARRPLAVLAAFRSPRSAGHIARECVLALPKLRRKLFNPQPHTAEPAR